MGFLDSSSNDSVILTVTNEEKLLRPLAKRPQTVWVHKIHRVQVPGPDEQIPTVLRKFKFEVCLGARNGCALCAMKDPLWNKLDEDSKFDRNKKPVHFPKTPQHLLPVYLHSDKSVWVLRGGNQMFEEMDKWYDKQPKDKQDLARCDWSVWKEGTFKKTQYKSMRQDESAFPFTDELMKTAKDLLAASFNEYKPLSSSDLTKVVNGQDPDDGSANNAFVLPPLTAQQPQLTATAQLTPQFHDLTTVAPPAGSLTVPAAPTAQPTGGLALGAFQEWVNSQPEFKNMGLVNTFIPLLKESLNGSVEYNKCSPEQLSSLQTALTAKLAAMRSR
jgi:hypothetical protein